MFINIYALVHPSTKEVIYVGQTKSSIENRLNSHYWKLNEAKKGKRTLTKLFKFLDSYLPLRVQIKLIKIVDTSNPFDNADFMEKYYIKYYRKINPNLLNEADGGIGGNTYKNKSNDEKYEIGKKISNAIKGHKKPNGFSEHLSEIRQGSNNPMAKKFDKILGCYKGNELITTFNYSYEIDNFIGKKGAWSNIKKSFNKINSKPYGYIWKYIE